MIAKPACTAVGASRKVRQQRLGSGQLQRGRQRAEHRLNERNSLPHLGQGDPLSLQYDEILPLRATQSLQPAPILRLLDRVLRLYGRQLAALDIERDAPVHDGIQPIRAELDEVEIELLLKFQRQLGQTPGARS